MEIRFTGMPEADIVFFLEGRTLLHAVAPLTYDTLHNLLKIVKRDGMVNIKNLSIAYDESRARYGGVVNVRQNDLSVGN